MTREEEVIKELNTLKISTKSESGKNALDFAIQLLKQKMPDCEHCIHTYGTFGCCDMINYEWVYDCEFGKEQYKKEHKPQPSEDYISRQEAIEQLYQVYDILLDAERKIKELPPVTLEPKIGHWIHADSDDAICSCCNHLNHLYGTYCKHCGAKMGVER